MTQHINAHNARICLAIATPIPFVSGPDGAMILDTISPRWHRARCSLSHSTNLNLVEYIVDGQEVGVARSIVAAKCLAHKPQAPEFLFFLDYDVLPNYDALTKLFFRARCYPDHDIFAGVYCCKHMNPPDPLIYAGNGQGPFWDWTVGDILTTEGHGISAVHMGLTLIRVSLFQRMIDAGLVQGDGTDQDNEPFFRTIYAKKHADGAVHTRSGTEDIYFCDKARELGAKILVDTSVLAGHHDKRTDQTYGLPWNDGPAARAKWLSDRNGKPMDDEPDLKKALDVGAGDLKREWDGYRTWRTDIRPESHPDYCQDTRMLNLPEDHFDLVATAHHLEHFGRYEQEKIWAELVRVCKPGGRIEFILPNLEWAAAKIVENTTDERTFDVLFGAQERFGFARDYNTHYFGFTPEIAKDLAEQAGLVDIKITTYKDDPQMKWEILLEARKPTMPKDDADTHTNGAVVDDIDIDHKTRAPMEAAWLAD